MAEPVTLKVKYSARYLRVPGAEILADLLQGSKLDSQVQVEILTIEVMEAKNAFNIQIVVFLVGDESSYISAADSIVDGGFMNV